MKKIKILLLTALFAGTTLSCKDQLDVKNPNQPTPASAATENGVIALAQGGVYVNGFSTTANKYYDGVVGAFFNGVLGFHDIMGDQIGVEAANSYLNQLGCPDEVTLDDGTKVINPNSPTSQIALLRSVNVNAQQGGNPGFHEWATMYGLNNSCNSVLDVASKTTFTGDAAAKLKTIQAWAYFWKGFAYSRIGSMYYAGLINNTASATNGNYVTKEKVIEEANANFDKAAALLAGLSSAGYQKIGRAHV